MSLVRRTNTLSICACFLMAASAFAQGPGGGRRGGPGGGPPPFPQPTPVTDDRFNLAIVQTNEFSPFGVDNPFVKMGAMFKWNGEEGADILKTLGAAWIMPSPLFGINRQIIERSGENDFTRHDAYVRFAQALNLHILFIVGPLEPGGPPPGRGPNGGGPGMPKDFKAFSSFVEATVEHYDGDGKRDMAGLRYPVKYWMILDEPFFKRYWSGTAEEYLKLYLAAYHAAKKADPTCVPVLSSLYTPYEEKTQDFAKEFIRLYLEAVKHGDAPKQIDALDYHWISKLEADAGLGTYRDGKDWLTQSFAKGGVTIKEWTCTEACIITQDREAVRRDVVKRYALARTLGISKIFWSSLVTSDPEKDPFTAISLKVTDHDPVLTAYQFMTRMMGSGPCGLKQDHSTFTVSCPNGISIVWSESDTDWVSPAGATATYYDVGGQKISTAPTRLTTSPIYIKQ